MRGYIAAAFAAIALSACSSQLPNRSDGIHLNDVPGLDPTIIDSNNGLLSAGLSTVPGSYCFADQSGSCNTTKLSPAQCISANSTVEVAPKTNPTPAFDSLIDNKYTASATVPFANATGTAEQLDEVKATIAATAQFSAASPNNGYPGIDGLKACILKNEGPGNYGSVFWISSANIIDVTLQHFVQVSSTSGVSETGFGINGSTYNHVGTNQEKIWIGLQASAISVGQVQAAAPVPAAAPGIGAKALLGPPPLFVRSPKAEPLPEKTKTRFVH